MNISRALFLITVLMLSAVPVASAQETNAPVPKADSCTNLTPVIEIIPASAHMKYDMSMRAVPLNSRDAWGPTMVSHMAINAQLVMQGEYDRKLGKDFACQYMKTLTIVYRLEPVIRILNNYKPGTCEYNQTVAHEQKHIALAKEFQEKTSPLLRRFLNEIMTGQGGLRTGKESPIDQARTEMEQKLKPHLDEYAKYLNNQFANAQSRMLDTEAEMHDLFAACPGWQPPYAGDAAH